ncbi:MAG: hypothetical protein ABJI33_00030 [Balneola sp.]
METLKNLLRDLTDKLDQLLGKNELRKVPVKVSNKSHPNTCNIDVY